MLRDSPVALSGSDAPPAQQGSQLLETLKAARTPEVLRRYLQWLMAIRLLVVSTALLLYFLLTLLPREPLAGIDGGFLYLVGGLTFAASLVYLTLLSLAPRHLVAQAYLQFGGDLLIISALVLYFGGIASPFTILYLVVISVAAVLLRRQAAVLVASGAYLLYAGILLALDFGWLTSPHAPPADEISVWRLAYNLAAHLGGFYGVALLISFLARETTAAEERLEQNRENLADLQVTYQNVVQSISSGLVTTDLGGLITSINRAGEQLLARPAEDLVGRPISTLGLFSQAEWHLYAGDCRRGERVRTEVEITRPGLDGSQGIACMGFSMSLLTDSHGSHDGYILVFQDLTEWRRLQEEVRVKDRMAAVGEMAAGLAHEIGNPLAAISGSVQLLASAARKDQARAQLAEILLRESQRLDRTIKSFLKFARPKERAATRFDVAALLAEHAELLRHSRELGPEHKLELALEPPEAVILADADQVSQIFWNLARNALRAMPSGGTLRVRGRLRGEHYLLEVHDTGRGMSDEERSTLFQPFTTFFDGGTGIGMAIVYRIVEEHGGRVLVKSMPGGGTTITAELPVAGAEADQTEAAEVAGELV
jgi:two-component system, NtrC family, sensor histidine kinase PilS